jgi:molybdate transport system substrate-binding protein
MSALRVRGTPRSWLGVPVCVLLLAAGCGDAAARSEPDTVTVFAAASLTEAFTRIGRDFEAARAGAHVRFSFGASSTLAQQIVAGAPADVFAAASTATMAQVMEGGAAAGEPAIFARNQLVIAVAPGNPTSVGTLADLARPGLKVALCAQQVPCGAAARTALQAGHVTLTPVTLEQDVKAALTKVRLGEVDAALVYRTDVAAAAGQVTGIEFAESAQAVNDYLVVALGRAPDPAGAAAFVAYVRGEHAREVLVGVGFQTP